MPSPRPREVHSAQRASGPYTWPVAPRPMARIPARLKATLGRHRRTQTTYGQRAPKCWHLAHGFRIERPSERMYFQRRRSFPSTDVHWLVDAERRVNEMRSCSRILRRGCPGRSRRDAGTRSSASPSRGPPPGADLSARADMQASALRRPTELRGPRATRGVPPPWQRTCLRQWTNRRALRGRIDTTGRTPSNGS